MTGVAVLYGRASRGAVSSKSSKTASLLFFSLQQQSTERNRQGECVPDKKATYHYNYILTNGDNTGIFLVSQFFLCLDDDKAHGASMRSTGVFHIHPRQARVCQVEEIAPIFEALMNGN